VALLGVALPGIGVDRSAGPPSSSGVRGATDWQTGRGADALAVFYMVVTETEVTDGPSKTKKPPTLESEARACDLDGWPLTGCAARQVGKSPRTRKLTHTLFRVQRPMALAHVFDVNCYVRTNLMSAS
jgi:carbohydrate-binding DOMON domain-containing protein